MYLERSKRLVQSRLKVHKKEMNGLYQGIECLEQLQPVIRKWDLISNVYETFNPACLVFSYYLKKDEHLAFTANTIFEEIDEALGNKLTGFKSSKGGSSMKLWGHRGTLMVELYVYFGDSEHCKTITREVTRTVTETEIVCS